MTIRGHNSGNSAKTFKVVKKRSKSGLYGVTWQKMRLSHLMRQPLCVKCSQKGLVVQGKDVDHIIPHRGEAKLFYDMTNLQTLCKECHAEKTAGEVGRSSEGATLFPEWLPRSQKPMILVCGRPAAGKSHYVSENSTDSDLIMDLERLAEKAGKLLHELSRGERSQLIRQRNEILAKFVRNETRHDRCFVVTTASGERSKQFWKDRGAEVIIIDTPKEICQRRINMRDIPARAKEIQMQLTEDWR